MKNIPNCKKILFEIKNDEHNPGEQRYCVENADGQRMFLRISDKEAYNGKKFEHEMMERVRNLGVLTPKPIDFGYFDDENGEKSIYSLTSWIDGEDMEITLPLLTGTEQYAIGIKSGINLRLMHSIPAPDDKTPENWETQMNDEINWKVQEYKKAQLNDKIDLEVREQLKLSEYPVYEEYLLNYIEKNRYLLKNRPQGLLHYDYNLRNILLLNKAEPYVIDFGDYEFGDPWREFTYMFANHFPHFLTGMINGYFNNSIPEAFFPTLLLYSSIHALQIFIFDGVNKDSIGAVPEHVKYHNNMSNPLPAWYLSHYTK